jgi:putative ABC transport system permease protein
MKYGYIIAANLLRKKTRLWLTIGSFATALFLFAFLAIVRDIFNAGGASIVADRLIVTNRVSLLNPLPLSYGDRILRIPGVKYVTHLNWFAGVYQDERNTFPQFAVDTNNQRQVFSDYVIPDDQWNAFLTDRQGAIAGVQTAERFHWKIGDRIPIKSTLYGGGTWEFNLVGLYHCKRPQDIANQFWFQWDYFEEKVPQFNKGQVGFYFLRIANPDDAVRVSSAIDAEFRNSPYETRTASESTFIANRVKQFANIQFLIRSIGTVVLFTLLLVTGNTMAISIRERTAELAVFKAVGFSDRLLLLLVLAESLVIALIGGALGLMLASLAMPVLARALGGMFPNLRISPHVVLYGLAAAVLVGIVSGLLPGLGAMHLRIVNGLRRV